MFPTIIGLFYLTITTIGLFYVKNVQKFFSATQFFFD